MATRTKSAYSVAAGDRRRVARPWPVPIFESAVLLLSLMVLVIPVQAQTPSGTPAPVPGQTVVPSQVIQGPTITMPGQPVNPALGLWGLPPTKPLTLEHAGLVCSDPALSNACGYETADKLGTYKLNMSCSDGFYDPIWGGTCWKCPAGDGWIRSANNIQNDDACWRVPKETTAGAQRVKNTPWAWDCSSPSFWDGYDGGACWKCPRRATAANGICRLGQQGVRLAGQ